ncbi:hypothetical protein SPRG_02148 [Saprolegnia parasitica CBS 223.65]|uniref:Uncharacterized protein n=1 Tax=Saprolegnia parasitica (strain CBS 223.65) TaxID=695850 RepID=A0A067D3N1_SAPPC|nr:hypothetical protein SPRG_02148 [Saprolegnia parasitica CBS 223.65]KDO33341.1 hypothetical protein SPRG_02148 [Saprolegnia parasitica CBS 223.65]|eukprot:XP_012196089.1 hypothetical protein SPRG_02148 [Saprolegnia parasitica CBS 223.65]
MTAPKAFLEAARSHLPLEVAQDFDAPTNAVDAPTHAASLAWHTTKKLGSLFDDAADLRARKRLATTAFNNMWKIWMRRGLISEGNRVRLYKCYVLPVVGRSRCAVRHMLQAEDPFNRPPKKRTCPKMSVRSLRRLREAASASGKSASKLKTELQLDASVHTVQRHLKLTPWLQYMKR